MQLASKLTKAKSAVHLKVPWRTFLFISTQFPRSGVLLKRRIEKFYLNRSWGGDLPTYSIQNFDALHDEILHTNMLYSANIDAYMKKAVGKYVLSKCNYVTCLLYPGINLMYSSM